MTNLKRTETDCNCGVLTCQHKTVFSKVMLGRHIRCQEALILSFTSKFSRFKRILREAYLVLQNK